MAMSI